MPYSPDIIRAMPFRPALLPLRGGALLRVSSIASIAIAAFSVVWFAGQLLRAVL